MTDGLHEWLGMTEGEIGRLPEQVIQCRGWLQTVRIRSALVTSE